MKYIQVGGSQREVRILNSFVFGPFRTWLTRCVVMDPLRDASSCVTCTLQALLDLFFDPLRIVHFQVGRKTNDYAQQDLQCVSKNRP